MKDGIWNCQSLQLWDLQVFVFFFGGGGGAPPRQKYNKSDHSAVVAGTYPNDVACEIHVHPNADFMISVEDWHGWHMLCDLVLHKMS